MTEHIRVRWNATGHHSTIPAHRFDSERHTKLKSDAVDRNGVPLPPKYKTNLPSGKGAPKGGGARTDAGDSPSGVGADG